MALFAGGTGVFPAGGKVTIGFAKSEEDSADTLSLSGISAGLSSDFVGGNLHVFDELESTNATAREMAINGAPEGTAVVAGSQSGGRGRRGRHWFSPPGKNIYTSVVLRPEISPAIAPQLTLMTAVVLAETLSQVLNGLSRRAVEIKWPNDILVGGKKCAGILTEIKTEKRRVDFVIVGIGINVNAGRDDFPADLADIATSLLNETGESYLRTHILQRVYMSLESWYKRYLTEGFPPVMERWNALSCIIGRYVRAASGVIPGTYEEGVALGINGEGALILRGNDDRVIKIMAGDVETAV